MKSVMRKDLKERYLHIEPVLRLVTALDQRFKQLPFLTDSEKSAVYAHMTSEICRLQNLIKVKVEFQDACDTTDADVVTDDSPPLPSVPGLQDSKTVSPIKKRTKLEASTTSTDESALGSILGDVYITIVEPPKSPIVIAEQPVNEYQSAPPIPLHSLQWWKANEFRFPFIAQLAKVYLCIPATSIPSERVFSTAGDILNAQRSRHKSKHVDSLIFLKKNMP